MSSYWAVLYQLPCLFVTLPSSLYHVNRDSMSVVAGVSHCLTIKAAAHDYFCLANFSEYPVVTAAAYGYFCLANFSECRSERKFPV